MYAIISNGAEVALCDKPRYVRKNDNGVWVEASEDAQAISVNGILYNLPGGTAVDGAPEAVAVKRNGGGRTFENMHGILENAKTASAIEDAMCEMDAAGFSNMAAIEDALCEIDMMIEGGTE